MYFVPAPVAACEDFPERPSETAGKTGAQTRTGLKLVSGARTEETPGPAKPDAATLAARILQLHTASQASAVRPPRLVGAAEDQEEPDFKIPGVLTRASGEAAASKLAPQDPPRQPEQDTNSATARKGSGVRLLLAGVALAVLATGGAVYYIAEARPLPENGFRTVETRSIETVPAIESPIAAETSTDTGAPADEPSPSQIAAAKDRIRDAFASAGRLSAPQDGGPQTARQTKTQARLASPPVAEAADRPAHPVAAAPAAAVSGLAPETIGNRAVPAKSAGTAGGRPDLPGGAEARTPASPDPDLPAPAPEDPAFANTGKTSAAVNLRQAGDSKSAVVTVVPAGADVRYSDCGPWWCSVSYEGRKGFIGQSYLQR
jgi:hypothetical protein